MGTTQQPKWKMEPNMGATMDVQAVMVTLILAAIWNIPSREENIRREKEFDHCWPCWEKELIASF